MAILRRDDTVCNTIGTCIPGAEVYYLTQPADVDALTPLAAVYENTGGTPSDNPQATDGFGHAVAYLLNGQLYTVVYVFPNGTKISYPDQSVGDSTGGSTYQAFSGIPDGAVDGTNKTFTLTNGGLTPGGPPLTKIPAQMTVWVNFPIPPTTGYTVAIDGGVAKITFANAPQPQSGTIPADTLFAQGMVTI